MNADDIMTREVRYTVPRETLAAAYRWMAQHKVRHLPVCEDNGLVGILSDRDLLIHATRDGNEVRFPAGLTVADAMTEWPITIRPSATISKAAELMLEFKIDALPVVEGAKTLVGIVTSSDLLVLLIGRNHAIVSQPLPFLFTLAPANLEIG